ncbi:MAG TPA: F0F1 ATP synthase subunit delta [Bacteriovoracaceae bacterium]|nr:F0F1 ATP synthase subunit delta [Bacteriovoracaceae bacterium]
MREQAVAKVYAKSILELGDEAKVQIADELTRFTEVINGSNELENVLFLQVFTLEEKKAVFNQVATKLNLSPLTTQVVSFLIDENRINILPLIFKEIIVMDDDRKGFIKGTIEGNGTEIDPAFKAKIEAFLKEKLGRTPELKYVTNTNVTAGYKVVVEDLQLDASLDNQLEQFKQSVLSDK